MADKRPSLFNLLVFLLPGLLIYTLFMIYPLVDSLRLGFFQQDPAGPDRFVGLQNYIQLLTAPLWAPRLEGAFKHSVLFFSINAFVQNPLALFLAALLASKIRLEGVYRTLIFVPAILSLTVTAFLWNLLLNPLWGIPKTLLTPLGLGAYARPWLGLEDTALWVLALISAWQFLGVPMLIYYAALLGIPNDLIESASMDGASGWRTFWNIKFPLILPVVGVITLITFIFNFNAFDVIYAAKGALAGPNYATDTLMTFFYRTFFGFELQKPNPTMGAAIAGVMFVVLLIAVLAYIYIWQRRVTSYEL